MAVEQVAGTVIDTSTGLTIIPEVAFNAVEDEYRDQARMLPMAAELLHVSLLLRYLRCRGATSYS